MRTVTRRDHGWERMGIGSAVADNQPKWVLEKGFRAALLYSTYNGI